MDEKTIMKYGDLSGMGGRMHGISNDLSHLLVDMWKTACEEGHSDGDKETILAANGIAVELLLGRIEVACWKIRQGLKQDT